MLETKEGLLVGFIIGLIAYWSGRLIDKLPTPKEVNHEKTNLLDTGSRVSSSVDGNIWK